MECHLNRYYPRVGFTVFILLRTSLAQKKKEYRYESCTYVAFYSFLRVSIIVPHSYRSFFQIFKFIKSAYERNKNRMKTTAKKYEILYIIELSNCFYNKI